MKLKRQELDAYLVAMNVARQIEGRVNYRKAVKMAISSSVRMGALGIKIQVAGRLNGVEMARTESWKEGRIPLHTFPSIDYACEEALTTYGLIGIKVWIFKGEVYGKRDLTPIETLNLGRKKLIEKSRNMLQPKRTKYRKMQKGRMKGLAQRGSNLDFGSFGIKALEEC